MIRYILLLLIISVTPGCLGHVSVHTDRGWMGPDVYYATDGETEVRYYNGQCCCVAKKVLQSLADKANNTTDLKWSDMADPEYKKKILSDQCKIERFKEWGHE